MTRIPLSDALTRYREATDQRYGNAYDWYRRSAQRSGKVSLGFGLPEITAVKVGRGWTVEEADVERVVAARLEEKALIAQRTADYDAHVLHPGMVMIEGGGYHSRGDFHFIWNDQARALHRSDGAWVCSGCFKSASEVRDREPCRQCQDGWSPCSGDCRLSRIYCAPCGTSLAM